MQTPEILDFDQLVAAISDDAPAGVDLRSHDETAYRAVRDARFLARRIEKDIDQGTEPDPKNPIDWNKVLQSGKKVLAEKTKDLEIAAYLIEALQRLHGVPGLRDGFRLVRQLVENFWDDLYPAFELEDDPPNPEPRKSAGQRVATLSGLNGDSERDGTLAGPIRRLTVVARSPRLGDFTFVQYQDAVIRGRETEQETIRQAALETEPAFYQTLFADLTACVEEFNGMTAALDQRCGSDSPASSSMKELLESVHECVKKLAGNTLTRAAAADAEKQALADAPTRSGRADGVANVLQTREEAFHTLQKVAEYFRRTEPHSFLSYSLEQVVRWGKTPLPELLVELIPNEDTRKELFKQVGIKAPPEKIES